MDIWEFFWPIVFPIAGAIAAFVHIWRRGHSGAKGLETILSWQLAVGLGIAYVYAGLGHLLFPERVAASIGWESGSPFQREVGLWDLSLGLTALLCAKVQSRGFWAATVILFGIFSIGAGIGHMYELVVHGNTSVSNAGPVMVMDFLYPIFLASLLAWVERIGRKSVNHPGSTPPPGSV